MLRLLGMNPNSEPEEVTEEEIRAMVDMGGESGAIEENEKEMIENIFEFNNRTAEDVMTHRTDVTSLSIHDTKDEIIATILDTGLSRFPVYDKDMDDIIGILNTRDFLLNNHAEHPENGEGAAARGVLCAGDGAGGRAFPRHAAEENAHGDRGGRVRRHERPL